MSQVSILQRLGERFWFIPAVLCAAALLLAECLIALDRHLGDLVVPTWVSVLLYRVGESGGRDILGSIASSSLAVAGTTFRTHGGSGPDVIELRTAPGP